MTLKTEAKNIGIFALLLTGMIAAGKRLDKGWARIILGRGK